MNQIDIFSSRILKLAMSTLILVVLGSLWFYCVKHHKFVDFYQYYLGVHAFLMQAHGYLISYNDWMKLGRSMDIVDFSGPFVYPPLVALMVWPINYLPPMVSASVWFILSVCAYFLTLYILLNAIGHKRSPFILIALCGLFFIPTLTTLYAGQINLFLLLTLAITFYAIKNDRIVLAAVALAAGILIKLSPLIFLAYFLIKRQWKLSIYTLIALLIIYLLTTPLVGLDGLYDYAIRLQMSHQDILGVVSSNINMALGGLLTNTISPVATAYLITKIISVIIILLTFGLCLLSKKDDHHRFDLEFSLIIITILLVSPFSWLHYYVLLIIPFMILGARNKKPLHWLFLGLMFILISFVGLFWHHFTSHQFLLSLPTICAILLWLYNAALIIRSKSFRFKKSTGTDLHVERERYL